MVALPRTPLLSKLNLALSVVCFCLYVISIPSPYWLKVRIIVPANPPDIPYRLLIRVHMGLYRACKNAKAYVPDGFLEVEDWCRSKDAPDWHTWCACLGVMAGTCSMTGLVAAVMSVSWTRVANSTYIKLVIAAASALAVGFMIPVLVLFNENRKNYRGIHYHLHYDYTLAIIGMILYFFHTLFVLADAFLYRDSTDADKGRLWTPEQKEGDPTRYT